MKESLGVLVKEMKPQPHLTSTETGSPEEALGPWNLLLVTRKVWKALMT